MIIPITGIHLLQLAALKLIVAMLLLLGQTYTKDSYTLFPLVRAEL
jgi:hypothetical protein